MIFVHRQLQEKALEHQEPINFILYDLGQAFDTVPRESMWAVLDVSDIF